MDEFWDVGTTSGPRTVDVYMTKLRSKLAACEDFEIVTVLGDPEMMSLVWNNLFSNAMKFTEKGGTVSLTLRTENGRAIVQVSDTGCGISKEVGAHIFEKFYQGDRSRATHGNGLGLALVKRIIDITGCDIAVESEVGKGTVFTVSMRTGKDTPKQTEGDRL